MRRLRPKEGRRPPVVVVVDACRAVVVVEADLEVGAAEHPAAVIIVASASTSHERRTPTLTISDVRGAGCDIAGTLPRARCMDVAGGSSDPPGPRADRTC